MSSEQIKAELVRLTKEVDMVQIIDKLGDGMARMPEGEVQNPVILEDKLQEKNNEVTVEEMALLEERYIQLKFVDQVYAENFRSSIVNGWQAQGRLPKTGNE
jgi:hypothetical protein